MPASAQKSAAFRTRRSTISSTTIAREGWARWTNEVARHGNIATREAIRLSLTKTARSSRYIRQNLVAYTFPGHCDSAHDRPMHSDSTNQAITIELRSAISQNWSVTEESGVIVVCGPDNADFKEEMWRLAEFIAYDAFVSIERQASEYRTYKITSRSKRGLFFEVIVCAIARAEPDAPRSA